MVHIQYTFYYFSANKKYPLFSILQYYQRFAKLATKLIQHMYIESIQNYYNDYGNIILLYYSVLTCENSSVEWFVSCSQLY